MLTVTWWLQLKMLSASAFNGILQFVWPLFFATTAFLVYRQNGDPAALVYAGLGSAVMGLWSAIATTASGALQRERWHGTLELLVAAPTPFALVLVPITVAMTTIGVYSMGATLLWGWLLFGIVVPVASPVLFVLSLVVSILAVAMFGFLLSVTRHPLPHRLGPREHARVPRLAALRLPRPGHALPDLGHLDLLGAAPDLGHGGGPAVLGRRVPVARPGPLRRPRSGVCDGGRPALGRRAPLRPPPRDAGLDMTSLRIFFVGGLISFRALFNWLSPWIYVPSLLVAPVFQVLLFAYLGRSAGVGTDAFYLVGNAVQYAAIPCVFAMANTIAGERQTQTLGIVLATPAPRLPLFLGRSLPVVVNGWLVSLFTLVVGSLILGVTIPWSSWGPLAVTLAVGAASCTGLGLVAAAIGLRVRETAVLANIVFGVLLLFSGANVAVSALPPWMAAVSPWLPLSHTIAAAREIVAGASLGDVGGLLLREAGVGLLYAAVGLVAIRLLEASSRRTASLERM